MVYSLIFDLLQLSDGRLLLQEEEGWDGRDEDEGGPELHQDQEERQCVVCSLIPGLSLLFVV